MTYPSGLSVTYSYTNGFITGVNAGGTQAVSNVSYNSLLKQAISWNIGGSNVQANYNVDGALTGFSDGGFMNQSMTNDATNQISTVKDSSYSNQYASSSFNGNHTLNYWETNVGWGYVRSDSNWNMTNFLGGLGNLNWNINGSNNQISSFINRSNQTLSYSYDNNGNTLSDDLGNYGYDLKNNMVTSTRTINNNTLTGNYLFNGLNERVAKSVNNVITYFIYNENHQLIGEYDNNGNAIAEYVYFGLRPVAVKTNGQTYIVHTDYLSTPRLITDGSNTVWKWDNLDLFGNSLAVGNITFNLRFAGQYFDFESNFHYNIFRTYNPSTGRYMQSDPLGLIAGTNTYNYVGKNPMNMIDPLGLDVVIFLDSFNTGFFGGTSSPGHVGLGVTNFDGNIWHNLPGTGVVKGDFFSGKNSLDNDAEGFINKKDDNDYFSYIKIKTTAEQDAKLIEFLNNEWKNKKKYVPFSNDCVTFVKRALDYAHIQYYYPLNPFSYSKTPNSLFNDIASNNNVIAQGSATYVNGLQNSVMQKQILSGILK